MLQVNARGKYKGLGFVSSNAISQADILNWNLNSNAPAQSTDAVLTGNTPFIGPTLTQLFNGDTSAASTYLAALNANSTAPGWSLSDYIAGITNSQSPQGLILSGQGITSTTLLWGVGLAMLAFVALRR